MLLPFADDLPGAAARLVEAFDDAAIEHAVISVPDSWLQGSIGGAEGLRQAYRTWLRARRQALPHIIDEANRVRSVAGV